MPILFTGNTGRVTALEDSVAAGSFSMANVSGVGIPFSYRNHRTIITKIGLSAQGNFQFLHTLGNDVYLYVFGDRMGEIVLHGISFQSGDTCLGTSSSGGLQPSTQIPTTESSEHGFELLYRWYKTNRVAANPNPVKTTIGTSNTFEGFVTSLVGNVDDPAKRTVSYQMTIALLPEAGRRA